MTGNRSTVATERTPNSGQGSDWLAFECKSGGENELHASTRLVTELQADAELSHSLAAGLEVLDLLNIGVAVTNGLRQLLFANHAAEQILLARDGLEVTPQGVLASLNRCSNPLLKEAVHQAAQASRETRGSGDAVLAVQRPSGKRPLIVLVRPLRSSLGRLEAFVPAVLVLLSDPEQPVRDTEARLRQLYGLTSCEARLANLLMEGKTLDDCCSQLDIRTSTARMHLGNLFAKTGVQRQSQLVSLLWKSVGMIRTQREATVFRFTAGTQLHPHFP